MRVGLIACGQEKLDHAAPAADLYTSRHFKAARAYVEATCDAWAILSAKHGLVMPDRVLEPYDARMPTNADARHGWARRVNDAVVRRWCEVGFYPHPEPDHMGGHPVLWDCTREGVPSFVILAGVEYRTAFEGPFVESGDCLALKIEVPMRGLAIGEQYSWLKANTPSLAGAA